jgi:alkanesulfonate monooxygenase SsuD/methylene tetrahydromethanopterin reductase-like flavin-dependent oxidoreductase (luciferase family)
MAMRFGTYHTYQVPPWTTTDVVMAEELERVKLAETLGFDSVWVPEQHFYDYCACPDALDMVVHLLGQTSRVRVGAAVVNLTLTHPPAALRRARRAGRPAGPRASRPLRRAGLPVAAERRA